MCSRTLVKVKATERVSQGNVWFSSPNSKLNEHKGTCSPGNPIQSRRKSSGVHGDTEVLKAALQLALKLYCPIKLWQSLNLGPSFS